MGPSHRFFRKAVQPAPKVRKVKPNHKGKMLVLTLPNGRTRFISSAKAAIVMGSSKGARMGAAKGTPHRWTSATGKKASDKLWRTKYRFLHNINARIGTPLRRRKKVSRPPLRYQYCWWPSQGIIYNPTNGKWWLTEFGVTRAIRERTALTRLGHHPSTRKYDTLPTAANVAPLVQRGQGKKEKV